MPNAFQQENLAKLTRFSAEAFPEAARRFHSFYSCADPAGPLPGSLFDQPSASLSLLGTLQKAVIEQEKMATNQVALYNLTAAVSEHGSLEELVAHLVSSKRSASPGPSSSAPKKPKAGAKGDKAPKDDKATKDARSDGKKREGDRSRSPSAGRESRGSSPARSERGGSPSPNAIGSRKDAVHHSADGKTFWYKDMTGKRASPVYIYDVLESLAGKSRHELDFPVILSSKSSAQARATLCCFEGKPGHEHAGSSAHLAPYADFVAKVHSHFQSAAPAAPAAPAAASGAHAESAASAAHPRDDAWLTHMGTHFVAPAAASEPRASLPEEMWKWRQWKRQAATAVAAPPAVVPFAQTPLPHPTAPARPPPPAPPSTAPPSTAPPQNLPNANAERLLIGTREVPRAPPQWGPPPGLPTGFVPDERYRMQWGPPHGPASHVAQCHGQLPLQLRHQLPHWQAWPPQPWQQPRPPPPLFHYLSGPPPNLNRNAPVPAPISARGAEALRRATLSRELDAELDGLRMGRGADVPK